MLMISGELLRALGAIGGIVCILLLSAWIKRHCRKHK